MNKVTDESLLQSTNLLHTKQLQENDRGNTMVMKTQVELFEGYGLGKQEGDGYAIHKGSINAQD